MFEVNDEVYYITEKKKAIIVRTQLTKSIDHYDISYRNDRQQTTFVQDVHVSELQK